jgi:sigma-54 dependent transcriptional regulator, acetoin dehydrogenase operon transcriptional activator AcoR
MKTIALVNDITNPHWENTFRENFKEVFGDEVEVVFHTYDGLGPGAPIQCDLVLEMRQSRIASLKSHLPEPRQIMVLNRTLRRQAIQPIFSIPAGASVLVVNDSLVSTMDSVGLFMVLDLNHLHFVPYEPGMDCSAFQIAVTLGEPEFVPRTIETVIDVGHRCIDISSCIEIMRRLGLSGHALDQRLLRYSSQIIALDRGVDSQYRDLFLKNVQLNSVLNLSREGILVLSPRRRIVHYNQALATMLGLPRDVTGASEEVLAPEIRAVLGQKTGQEWLLDYRGRSLVVTRQAIEQFGETTGYCFNFQEVSYLRQLEQNLNRKLLEKGLTARYRFPEVLARSPRMKKCVELAKRIAQSDLTVLIMGESGTGKELLAQSIHNASARKSFPFVAVNCAAMPESLLESELFGYEGGSFTGALREGKVGLFEQANNGTVFLDELADMPVVLQAKLLRVLQERQITRLGSQRVISVNLRVLAATNQNLQQRVRDGQFRKDLYYRLNAVTLVVPPLRERREDIFPLVQSVLVEQNREDLTFAPDAEDLLLSYSWPGNVRELKNVAQFLAFMVQGQVTLTDLPHDLLQDDQGGFSREKEVLAAQCGLGRARSILGALMDAALKDRGAGRKRLEADLAARGTGCTESEVRAALKALKQAGLVHSGPGRHGSVLTPRGQLFLESFDRGLSS